MPDGEEEVIIDEEALKIPDPGQDEGLPKTEDKKEDKQVKVEVDEEGEKPKVDPRDTSPPEGSKRWKKVYKGKMSAERENKDLTNRLEKTEKTMRGMADHNKMLSSKIDDLGKKNAEDSLSTLTERLADKKAIRIEARKDLKYEDVDKLDDEIFDLKMQIRDHEEPVEEREPTEMEANDVQDRVSPKDQRIYDQFRDNCPWYGDDELMTDAAQKYGNKLIQEGATMKESFEEVKEYIEKRFNYDSGDNGAKPPGNYGAEAGKSAGGKKTNTVKLSPDEVSIANGLGVTLEEFARQKGAN